MRRKTINGEEAFTFDACLYLACKTESEKCVQLTRAIAKAAIEHSKRPGAPPWLSHQAFQDVDILAAALREDNDLANRGTAELCGWLAQLVIDHSIECPLELREIWALRVVRGEKPAVLQ